MSISSEIQRLQGAKADIKAAIEDKGVTVPSTDKLDVYDEHIRKIGQLPFLDPAIPNSLTANSKVAIVALSSRPNYDKTMAAVSALEAWGLQVDYTTYMQGVTYSENSSAAASSYEDAVANLVGALQDDEIEAIICARGGYFSVHIIDLVPSGVIAANPKWFVGYSDVTGYLCEFLSEQVMSIHGPMCSSFTDHTSDDGSTEKLRKLLFGESGYTPLTLDDGDGSNVTGTVTGRLIGGNIATLRPYMTGEFSPFKYGNDLILLLEESGSYTRRDFYRIVKGLQYASAGRVKGIILGYDGWSATSDHEPMSRAEALRDCFPGVPIAFTKKIGHGDINYPVVVGSLATLSVTSTSASSLTFLQTGRRIETDLRNTELSFEPKEVVSGTAYETMLSTALGYDISSVSVTMGGSDITSTAYNPITWKISVASVTGDVKIAAFATALPIPAGYTPVEYVSARGTQWFDAGFKGSSNIDFDVTALATNDTSLQNFGVFGGRTSGSSKRYDASIGYSSSNNVKLGTVFCGYYNRSEQYTGNTALGKVRLIRTGSNCALYNNGVYIDTISHGSGTLSCDYNVYIGGINNAGTVTLPFTGRIYRLTFGTVADFVPVVRDSDGVAGFYDIVRDTFYHSTTGTEFLAPGSGYTEVDYLTCSAAQYFDTGVVGNDEISFEIGFTPTTTSGANALFGRYVDSSSSISVVISGTAYTRFGSKSKNLSWTANTSYVLAVGATGITRNGSTTAWSGVTTFTTTTNMYLGWNGSNLNFTGKIRYCKIWSNGTLVRDYVPRLDLDGHAGMLETVSGDFKRSETGTDFGYGYDE